ncbi:hypothetical protein ZWY2020_006464 [Hordeum vulgare]|nr:hypothetical protein ZWY2020_006464 [Hordeum vulgare]
MDVRMNATQRSRLQIIKAPTVIKPHDQEGVGVARPCQVQSDQEEDYTAADIILKNAIERRKLAIRARRASGGADHQAPHPPVHNLASLPPAAPAHRAGTKRQATWLPPGASGVRQLPQNQLQALAPPRQHPAAPALAQYQGQHPAAPALAQYQGQPAQMEYEAAPVPVPVHPPQPPQMEHEAALVPVPVHPPPKQRPRQHATTPAAPYAPHAPDAAARMPPRQVNTSSKPPLHPRSPANPAAGNKPSIVCRVCGVRCMTAFNLRQHEEGRRHRNNVANAAGEKILGVRIAPFLLRAIPYWVLIFKMKRKLLAGIINIVVVFLQSKQIFSFSKYRIVFSMNKWEQMQNTDSSEEFVDSSVMEVVELTCVPYGFVIRIRHGRNLRCVQNNREMTEMMGYTVRLVRITEMVHDAYYSRLYLSKIGNEEEVISFDLKPWDAINIAFRCKVQKVISTRTGFSFCISRCHGDGW